MIVGVILWAGVIGMGAMLAPVVLSDTSIDATGSNLDSTENYISVSNNHSEVTVGPSGIVNVDVNISSFAISIDELGPKRDSTIEIQSEAIDNSAASTVYPGLCAAGLDRHESPTTVSVNSSNNTVKASLDPSYSEFEYVHGSSNVDKIIDDCAAEP